MENKEIIEKLGELQGLLQEKAILEDKVGGGVASDYLGMFKQLKSTLGKPKNKPEVFSNWPYFSTETIDITAAEQKMLKNKKNLQIALIATAVVLAIYFISHWSFLNTVSVIGIFVCVGLALANSGSKNAYKAQKQQLDKLVEKETKADKEFMNALEKFENQKKAGYKAAEEYYPAAKTAYETSTQLLAQYGAESDLAVESLDSVTQKITEYTFMPEEYHHLVGPIISYLNSGRADSYKEALNLAIREERDIQERAQRAAEEERRTMIAARQAEEERRHNMQMEAQQEAANRQQAEHNRNMEAAERNRQRQEERNAREASAEQARAQTAANMRCAKCANHDACGKARGQINCGAFRPKY